MKETGLMRVIGRHLFNAEGMPVFEFVEGEGEGGLGSMVGVKVGDVVSPRSAGEEGAVDWLELVVRKGDDGGGGGEGEEGGEGQAVKAVYRVFTAGGKAPVDGCGGTAAGDKGDIEMQYAALYWFYG